MGLPINRQTLESSAEPLIKSPPIETSSIRAGQESVKFGAKLCYGIGDFGNGLAVSSINLWYLFFLTEIAAIPPAVAGLVIGLGRFWNALSDLFVGWFMEKSACAPLKSISFSALPYALCFALLWYVPVIFHGNSSSFFAIALFTLTILVFNSLFSLVFVPYASLTAVLTSDTHQRTALTAYRIGFSQTGMLLGATLPSLFASWIVSNHLFASPHSLGNSSPLLNFPPQAISWVCFGVFGMALLIFSLGIFFLGTSAPPAKSKTTSASLQSGLTRSFLWAWSGNRNFRSALLLICCTNMANTILAACLPYGIDYVLGDPKARSLLVASLFITAILSLPFWSAVSKRRGKNQTYREAMLWFILVLFLLPLILLYLPKLALLFSILSGFFFGAGLMLPWAIIADVADGCELLPRGSESSKPTAALYYGSASFAYKTCSACATLLLGFLLQFAGYLPGVSQSHSALLAICLGLGPLPALLLLKGRSFSLLNHEKL